MKKNEYTISQLANAAGIPATTLRYYERVGLLEAENRSAGNYRLYTEDSLGKLRFIRAAQGTGFTLDDIKMLLASEDGKVPRCGDVRPLIEERLADVQRKLRDLQEVKRTLQSALKKCKQGRPHDLCEVIDSLQSN